MSRSGMRLVCSEVPAASQLGVGSRIEVEFTAPHSGSALRVNARVAWMEHAPPPARGASLGVQFDDPPTAARSELAALVSSPRFTVVFASASPDQIVLTRSALQDHSTVVSAESEHHLLELVSRGGVEAGSAAPGTIIEWRSAT